MLKIYILLITAAYTIYFFLIPPLTLHDEADHIKIIIGVAHGEYPHTYLDEKDTQKLGMLEKLVGSLQFVDHADQIPMFDTVSKLKESKDDYDSTNVPSQQAYSPPFYYLVGAFFYFLSKVTPYLLGQYYIMRLASTVFYIGTVFIAWKILLLFFKNKKTAATILLFFSLNPLVLKMGIGINPDIGVTFFSLCVLYFLLKFSTKLLPVKSVVMLAVLSALATITKISGIFTNAVFTCSILFVQGLTKTSLRTIALFQGIFLLVTLPWFLFIFNRYGTFFPEPFSTTCNKLGGDPFITKFVETFTTFKYTLMNYAGFMGSGWPHPFKWFFISYVLLFLIFLIIGFIYVLKQKKVIYKILLLYITPLLLLLTTLSAQFRIKEIDCDIQGRYMLPIFFVLCLFVYWGIFAITKDESKTAKILAGFVIFHYLFILFTVLIIRYYV